MSSTLIVFSGLPGIGKSTLSRSLLGYGKAVYLRVDSVEAALSNSGLRRVMVEGYAVAYALALDNLRLGHDVVVDCVNPVSETRTAWQEIARQAEANLINVEVSCSDLGEHRRRVEGRFSDAANYVGRWSPPSWEEVLSSCKTYQPWTIPTVQIDLARLTPELAAASLLAELDKLGYTLPNAPAP
ncbi:ATP-binding protein [Deinococcus radiophilus]|nr:ATP-binding protein [Deinococcus radiophilus]